MARVTLSDILAQQKKEWQMQNVEVLRKRLLDIQYSYTPCNTSSTATRYAKDIAVAKRHFARTQGCQAKTIVGFLSPAYQVELPGFHTLEEALPLAAAQMKKNGIPLTA